MSLVTKIHWNLIEATTLCMQEKLLALSHTAVLKGKKVSPVIEDHHVGGNSHINDDL